MKKVFKMRKKPFEVIPNPLEDYIYIDIDDVLLTEALRYAFDSWKIRVLRDDFCGDLNHDWKLVASDFNIFIDRLKCRLIYEHYDEDRSLNWVVLIHPTESYLQEVKLNFQNELKEYNTWRKINAEEIENYEKEMKKKRDIDRDIRNRVKIAKLEKQLQKLKK